MKKLLLGVLLAFVPLVASAQVASPATPKHIVMIIEENHDFNQVAGSMPYLNSLASQYSLLAEMYANTHPSIGNYFELTTGNIVANDDNFSALLVIDNIAKQMEKKGLTCKVYAEDLPSVGYTGGDVDKYVKHHNPFAYFSNVNQNNIVPFSQFATDKANGTLPNFAFVVPNNDHNSHDGNLQFGDAVGAIVLTAILAAMFAVGSKGLIWSLPFYWATIVSGRRVRTSATFLPAATCWACRSALS